MNTALYWACAGLILLAGLLAPPLLSAFALTILTTAVIFSIFALSLDLILGHAGLPSLGHAVFLGLGAYTVGLLVKHGFDNFIVCVLAGVIVSAVVALLIGPVLLRTRTVYFLMATLAIGEVLRNVAISWRSVTGGDDGLSSIDPGRVLGIELGNARNFYFLSVASLTVTVIVMAVLTNSPFGHTLRALRDNRSRMAVLGVNPLSVEVTAFVISAALASFAGILLAYQKEFVYPNMFSVETSARALLMVVMGGTATLFGPVIGAFLVEYIRGIGSVYTDRWQTILGLLAVVVALNSREFVVARIGSLFRPRLWNGLTTADSSIRRPTKSESPSLSPDRPPPIWARPTPSHHALISAKNISKNFGGLLVLSDISFAVAPGERRGIIGPNGAGKTTFLNILSSTLTPTAGHILYGDKDITRVPPHSRARLGIGRTFQIANLFNDSSVSENLTLALVARDRYGLRLGRPLSRYSHLRDDVDELMNKWNLGEVANVKVNQLSYGQRRVLEIVLALATQPQLLLLDEPAAGLSGGETKLIIDTISALDPELALVVVDHDMDLIFSICDRITVFANGRVLAEGTGDQIRRDEAVIAAYLGMAP